MIFIFHRVGYFWMVKNLHSDEFAWHNGCHTVYCSSSDFCELNFTIKTFWKYPSILGILLQRYPIGIFNEVRYILQIYLLCTDRFDMFKHVLILLTHYMCLYVCVCMCRRGSMTLQIGFLKGVLRCWQSCSRYQQQLGLCHLCILLMGM